MENETLLHNAMTAEFQTVVQLSQLTGLRQRDIRIMIRANMDKWNLDIESMYADGKNPLIVVRKRQRLLIDEVLQREIVLPYGAARMVRF